MNSSSRTIRGTVFITVFLIICLLSYLWKQYGYLWILLRKSGQCATFHEWIHMVKTMNFSYLQSGHMTEPEEPHFILVNHIHGIGVESFITLSGIITNPCRIVCNKNYTNGNIWIIGPTMDSILQHEITVDYKESVTYKETSVINGITQAFVNNENVVIFIDAHDYMSPIRPFFKSVLSCFPERIKHLYLLSEVRDDHVFRMHGFQPTKNLDQIIQIRTDLLTVSKAGT
jgi:hypothetical protein